MASTHFKRSPIEKKLLTYMPLCNTTYKRVTISPTASHTPFACARFGPICLSSLRSLAKKTKASKIISAASISRQYTLGEKAEIFLYRELKRRIFFTKINERKGCDSCHEPHFLFGNSKQTFTAFFYFLSVQHQKGSFNHQEDALIKRKDCWTHDYIAII